MWGKLSMEDFFIGEESFHEGGAGFSSIILKNNEKINMKKICQLKIGAALKLKKNIKYYAY